MFHRAALLKSSSRRLKRRQRLHRKQPHHPSSLLIVAVIQLNNWKSHDNKWIWHALELARKAEAAGEVPVDAVIWLRRPSRLLEAGTSPLVPVIPPHLPYEFLDNVSRRIINEIDGISRVTYDIWG